MSFDSLIAATLAGAAAILSLAPAEARPGPAARSAHLAEPKTLVAPVTLAEVTVSGAGTSRLANLSELVRHDVEAELAAIDWAKLSLRRRYRLSASVVRLDSTRTGERALAASCTVSAAVRDERGNLLVIVEGRARAEDAPSAAAEAERDALAEAVRGAIASVPEAIRRSQ